MGQTRFPSTHEPDQGDPNAGFTTGRRDLPRLGAAPPWPPPCCVALGESPTFSGPYILTCAQEFGQGLVSPPRNLKARGDGEQASNPPMWKENATGNWGDAGKA